MPCARKDLNPTKSSSSSSSNCTKHADPFVVQEFSRKAKQDYRHAKDKFEKHFGERTYSSLRSFIFGHNDFTCICLLNVTVYSRFFYKCIERKQYRVLITLLKKALKGKSAGKTVNQRYLPFP